VNASIKHTELFVTGEANVLAQFTVTEGKRKLSVAGCRCMKGLLVKKNSFKLVRDGEVLITGKLCVCVVLRRELFALLKLCLQLILRAFFAKPLDISTGGSRRTLDLQKSSLPVFTCSLSL
jgi:hypothetical protein